MVLLPAITVRFFVSSACNAHFDIVPLICPCALATYAFMSFPLVLFLNAQRASCQGAYAICHMLMMHHVLAKYDWMIAKWLHTSDIWVIAKGLHTSGKDCTQVEGIAKWSNTSDIWVIAHMIADEWTSHGTHMNANRHGTHINANHKLLPAHHPHIFVILLPAMTVRFSFCVSFCFLFTTRIFLLCSYQLCLHIILFPFSLFCLSARNAHMVTRAYRKNCNSIVRW